MTTAAASTSSGPGRETGPDQPRFCLITFGCQMNQADAQRMRGLLSGLGYAETTTEDDADLVLFNTCCVRQHAEQRLFSRVQGLQALKRRRPHLVIAIAGCVAQEHQSGLLTTLPMADLVFGPNDIEQLPVLLQQARQERTAGAFVPRGAFTGDEADGIVLERPFAALVNIIRGCTNFCSYCIVPTVRGPEVSRPLAEIVSFCRDLAAKGVQEITVLGQNVNAYGKDIGVTDGFPRLLEALQDIDGVRWIRFITSHPRDFDPETVKRLARLSKVCEQFHLPVQAGSNRILAAMRRGYTRERFFALVDLIRAEIPGVCLTTDLICGFPGETDAEFEETIDLVRRVRFESAYMYYFSPRPGTDAATMPGQLPEAVRKGRLARLIEVQNDIALTESQRLIGQRFEVLVEARSTRSPGHLVGKTRTGRAVDFAGNPDLIGRFVGVTIERARAWTLSGTLAAEAPPAT
jgi:tRNA-2-methylthio-N6-dimethylallyladenosine synthase